MNKTFEQKFIKKEKHYTFFLVDISLDQIHSGWEYREDAADMKKELTEDKNHQEYSNYYRVWTRKFTINHFNKQAGIKNGSA